LSGIRIPTSVQAMLAARIDRLTPDEKDRLQTLAVISREFPLALVARLLSTSDDDELNHMLSDLQLGEFIYEQPATGGIEYTFKHALTQEVADSPMLTERREQIHQRAAQAIESLFAENLADHYTDLARPKVGRTGSPRPDSKPLVKKPAKTQMGEERIHNEVIVDACRPEEQAMG
jgi:predicted ATPase